MSELPEMPDRSSKNGFCPAQSLGRGRQTKGALVPGDGSLFYSNLRRGVGVGVLPFLEFKLRSSIKYFEEFVMPSYLMSTY